MGLRVQTASLHREDGHKHPPVDGALNFNTEDSYLIRSRDRWCFLPRNKGARPDQDLYPGFILKVDPSSQPFTRFDFIRQIRMVQENDNISKPCFFDHVIIATQSPSELQLDSKPEAPLDIRVPHTITIAHISSDINIVSGPCVIHGTTMWRVDGLREDKNGAFIAAIRPTTSENYEILHLGSYVYQSLSVAVPSKAATILDNTIHGKEINLKGVRLAIKDIFAVAGLKNSLCSRPYYAVATQALKTAPCISKLLLEGCVLVGMLKLSSFIGREEPTEAIDYQAPFNPRGDGYQSPAGSSSGSAASIASYDWLDVTIGSDTTGSGRRPAFVNGCFSLRLSKGQLPMDGMVTIFGLFDTQCLFTRDIWMMYKVLTVWLDYSEPAQEQPCLPRKLLFPRKFFPLENKVQMFHISRFLKDLSEFLQITVTEIDLASEWLKNSGESLETYLHDVDTKTFLYEFYHSFSAFRSEYRRQYDREPYVNAYTRWRWDIAKSITKEENQEALNRLATYRAWLLDDIFQPNEAHTYMILPIAAFKVNYRDRKTEPPSKQHAYDPLYISPTVGAPELVVPIAEIPYASRVSGCEEKLPMAVSIVGNPGSDVALVREIMAFLFHTERPFQVSTGPSAGLG